MTVDCEVPNLQVVEKLKSIPTIESALGTSANIYNRVKDSNELINWALQSAENALGTAVETVAVPLANRFQQPIAQVDTKLCQGIDVLQEKVPIVKEPPAEIYDKAKTYVTSTIPPTVQSISDASIKLRDDSWNKANELLSSRYGSLALSSFDKTSTIADKCIDYCLPPEEGEADVHPHSNAECPDKVMHTVHTVGALSTKMGCRVYQKLARRFSDPANTTTGTPALTGSGQTENNEVEVENREENIVGNNSLAQTESSIALTAQNIVVPEQPTESSA